MQAAGAHVQAHLLRHLQLLTLQGARCLIAARKDLTRLVQGSQSVEVYAADFVWLHERITLGADVTTQAHMYNAGSNGSIRKLLVTMATLEALN